MCVCVSVSYLVVSDSLQPIDCSPPGPSAHGENSVLQARTLEWVAISLSKRNYRKKESEVTQSCPTLCDPMDCSLPGSPIHGIFQARVLEWVAISFSDWQYSTRIYIQYLVITYYQKESETIDLYVHVLQSLLHTWNTVYQFWQSESVSHSVTYNSLWPMDCSPPGSSVHGILQARILEWVAISFSRGSSQHRDQTWVSCIAGRFFTIWATWVAHINSISVKNKTNF